MERQSFIAPNGLNLVAKKRNIHIKRIYSLTNEIFRKTFFDLIDEHILFPSSMRIGALQNYAVSIADSKIITTEEYSSFNLFWLEADGWIESVVDFYNFTSFSLIAI